LLTAYGDTTKKLISPRPTLEKKSDSRITFLLNTTNVFTAYGKNETVFTENIMDINIRNSTPV